jgi:hypothetical protein
LLAPDFAKGCPQFGHDAACVETSFPHAGHFISGIAPPSFPLFGFDAVLWLGPIWRRKEQGDAASDIKSERMKPAFLAGVGGITGYLHVEIRAIAAFWILG